jgi:protein tyrosine phosphatase (PTP) superfamily phosphohydrolase (DUF442 family)
VSWDGARNLIDLGGLPLVGGGETAYGRVWRSAAPEWMTYDGWVAARADGLATVVDLRNAEEAGRTEEHPAVPDEALAGVAVLRTPTEDPHDPAYLEACGLWLDHPTGWRPNVTMYPAKLAGVFTAIADADGPVLVHCAGGRDRTGMVCAMLLQVGGVEPEAIAANYAAGFRGAAAHRGHGLAYRPGEGWVPVADAQWSDDEVEGRIADRLPVVREFLATFDTADYLREAGLDADRITRLRTLLRAVKARSDG